MILCSEVSSRGCLIASNKRICLQCDIMFGGVLLVAEAISSLAMMRSTAV